MFQWGFPSSVAKWDICWEGGPTALETILSFLSKDASREAASPVLLENSSHLGVHPLRALQRQHSSALLSWALSEPNPGIEPDTPQSLCAMSLALYLLNKAPNSSVHAKWFSCQNNVTRAYTKGNGYRSHLTMHFKPCCGYGGWQEPRFPSQC